MKRRDFIKSSILALSSVALMTSGCGVKGIIKSKKQVHRKKFKDITLPALGLGCLRLPMDGDKVNMVEMEKMTDYAIKHGANYFDTACTYIDGKSEKALGDALRNYNRSDYLLADKTPPG